MPNREYEQNVRRDDGNQQLREFEMRQFGDPERFGGMRRIGRPPRGYQRSDERIKEDICDRVMYFGIDAEDVEIQVAKGEVTLTGTVEDRWTKRAIEDVCDHVLGVKDVSNQLRIEPTDDEESQSSSPSRSRKSLA
jgi:osmotically-inducible protein OsmY